MPYWKLEPVPSRSGAVNPEGARLLAEAGERYVVYVPQGGQHTVGLQSGAYRVRQYDPRTGVWTTLGQAEGSEWTTPSVAAGQDAAFVLERAGR